MAVAVSEVESVLARFAALDEKDLARPWHFRDKPMDVRYALYRTIEDAQVVLVRATATPRPESRQILALAQRAFGDLRGLLIGLPEELLDTARDGEWSLRDILRHVIVIEGRYSVQTRYAIERADTDPMRVAPEKMPTPEETDVTGDVGRILRRLADVRTDTDGRLGDVPSAAMTRPTQWMHYDVDVRFRLHRFAAHLVEHTVQCEKALAALGWRATEGRRIVRRLTALVGEIEGLGEIPAAREIAQVLVERSGSAL